ncbi:MAG: nicotinate-nucleotide adenylyltransferase [Lachnospiraceae bacterium]|nr:nicotinate-nucleotide adenylyltransferase [Lachnospiraceae bacterium]
MKVGIFGGTFDPIHLGHIAIAKAAKEQFGLDMVRIMPARIPPHKQTKAVTEDVHRLMMISLALPVGEGIELDLTEFEREGVSYTSDTLTLLHERHPGDELYYIIGEDSLRDFVTWHEPKTIASLATILVAVRSTDASHFQQLLAERNQEFNGAFQALSVPFRDISSTDIRTEIAKSEKPHPALAERTDTYIRRFGLYGCEPYAIRKETLKRYRELAEKLAGTISAHRLNHSKGVAFMSANLMAEWLEKEGLKGTAEEKKLVRRTLIAGLLHDCAKSMGEQETEAYLKKHRVRLSEEVIPIKGIHHGPAGRILARERYGIRDTEMLRAIGNHCDGSVDMAEHPIETAVFIADFTEPFRDHIPTPPLPVIRSEALRDGIAGAETVCGATIFYLKSIGSGIPDEMYRIHDRLKEQLKKKGKG